MPLPTTNTLPPRELAPEGTHQAVCIGHYHLGTQDTPFGPKEQIMLTFALNESRADGKPFLVTTKSMTLSFDDRSGLSKIIKSWLNRTVPLGQEFDTASLLNRQCMLTLSHGTSKMGKAFVSIDAVIGLPKGMPAMSYDGGVCDYSPIDPSREIPAEVPAWIQNIIKASIEWAAADTGEPASAPVTNGHAPAASTTSTRGNGTASGMPENKPAAPLPMPVRGYAKALGLPDHFDDKELDAALAKAGANSTPEEIAEAEAALRPHTIPF